MTAISHPTTLCPAKRETAAPVVLGAVLWLMAPQIVEPGFGSIEHVFLLLPLVLAPLALRLLSRLTGRELGLARRTQPFAAAALILAFAFPKGPLAGALAGPWLALALLVTASALRRKLEPNLVAASVFLPAGAIWLLLSRLGIGPHALSESRVFLAAVHFHFSGFMLQILVVATGRHVRSEFARLQRLVAVGAIAALPQIAAGHLFALPALKAAGVFTIVSSTLGLSITSFAVSRWLGSRLLLVSSLSLALGMMLALVYELGEIFGASWLGIAPMVLLHGLTNAIGFAAAGLIGHLRSPPAPA
jgi:hypothetical protein